MCIGDEVGESSLPTIYSVADALEVTGSFRKIIVLAGLDREGNPNKVRFFPTTKNVSDMATLLSRSAVRGSHLWVYFNGRVESEAGELRFALGPSSESVALLDLLALMQNDNLASRVFVVESDWSGELDKEQAGVFDEKTKLIAYQHESPERVEDDATGEGLFVSAFGNALQSIAVADLGVQTITDHMNEYMSEYCLDNFVIEKQGALLYGQPFLPDEPIEVVVRKPQKSSVRDSKQATKTRPVARPRVAADTFKEEIISKKDSSKKSPALAIRAAELYDDGQYERA